ncbi:hypothetical protein C8A00DRAFT_18047 [Chaetomidium leptoderma]|uniref:Uncharacterized protein n=1 Tax=Chaetomidium leptoderma TaxID=669021 RepID=A0AAN6ZVI9_9PEZI|nr:hypothetical protein C8A00DRAFT_18047 [Chaetomidium leptoderma]
MRYSERARRAIRARDLVAYSDAELGRYLEEHRLEGGLSGAIGVNVEDPENLPETFIQRLRDWAHNASNAAQAGAVDLNEVNARLFRTAAGHDAPEPAPESAPSPPYGPYLPGRSPTRTPIPPQVGETESYMELVDDGGRPMYPIEIIDDVARDPTAYRHLVRPWSRSADTEMPEWWQIFDTQLGHWQSFRRWQAHNRREGTPSRVEISGRWLVDAAYNVFLHDFRLGSPTYTDASSKLLAQYGFTQTVRFRQGRTQQDKLAEWTEYLTWECAVHHWYAHTIRRGQPAYDKAWKTLVDSDVLRSSDTEENIRGAQCGYALQSERERAERAVQSAESALKAAEKSASSRHGSASARTQTLSMARSRLDEAKKSLRLVQRRNGLIVDFCRATANFEITKQNAKQQEVLIRWVLDEIPRVKAELRGPGGSDTDAIVAHDTGDDQKSAAIGRPKGALKRGCDETLDEELPSKRLKTGGQAADAHKAQSSDSARPPPRRSARIAARQQAQSQPVTLSPTPASLGVPGKANNGPRRRAAGHAVRRGIGQPKRLNRP